MNVLLSIDHRETQLRLQVLDTKIRNTTDVLDSLALIQERIELRRHLMSCRCRVRSTRRSIDKALMLGVHGTKHTASLASIRYGW